MPSNIPQPRPGIMEIRPYVGGKSQAKTGIVPVKLSSNETPLGPSPLAVKAYQDAGASLHRYPEGSARVLREAIAAHHKIPADRIVCGAGSDELIAFLIHAYCGPGTNIVMSRHGFLMYKIYAQGFGTDIIFAPEKNLRADVDALLAAVNDKTRIVFVANPNNPTGSYLTKQELARLHRGLPPHVLLVVDAAYAEYAQAEDYSNGLELAESSDNAVMLRTFSKIYGLAALRVGWAYGPAHVIDVLNRVRGPFNVSTPAMLAAAAALFDRAFTEAAVRHNATWLDYLSREITALGLKVYPSIANFALVEFPGGKKNAEAANAFLYERGLIVRAVGEYGLPDCLRISVSLEEHNRAVIAALSDFMKG